jgi:Transglycosylase SLT domain/D-alanyl-D-alanine carboxypeptidase
MEAEAPLLVAVTSLPGAVGGAATAAAVGVALARSGASSEPLGVVLIDAESASRPRPTLVSSAPARALEASLQVDLPAVARGTLCTVTAAGNNLPEAIEMCGLHGAGAVVVRSDPETWRELVDTGEVVAAVLRADTKASRPLTALVTRDLIASGISTGVVPRPPGLVATRRALAGIEPGGELGLRAARFARRFVRAQNGQAAPITLFLALAVVVVGALLAMLGSAATGASRFQRAADLAAVSAARSMRDDHHRLFLPPALPSGVPNPAHLSDSEYRQRATAAAFEAATANGAEEVLTAVTFPGAAFAPTRVRVVLSASLGMDGEESGSEVRVTALAEAYPVGTGTGATLDASGGGYSGPLATRQGEGMRPDVAGAFDAMFAAASGAGHALTINSAFRSDAEQAALFAANPDPRMVARPGTSLHRCGTELDLGPPSAYGWLAANAQRFGFVQRYAWEAWHYGYERGPAPCSSSGDRIAAGRESDGAGSQVGLPSFVPARFRAPLAQASSRWNVPVNVLAAQLLAESNFNPLAVSPTGASGIAQFMPGTAAAYGLADPFDPHSAIDAQAHLMSDLIRQFGDVSLALAAYNAGPAPVAACSCVPAYPETQGYVARILGMMGGVGTIVPPALEVRLIG